MKQYLQTGELVEFSSSVLKAFPFVLVLILIVQSNGNWLDDFNDNRIAPTSEEDEITYIFPIIQANDSANVEPRHVHLSRKFSNMMTVTWSTKDLPDFSFVEYGSSESTLNSIQNAGTDVLNSRSIDGAGKQYIHEATMSDVEPGQVYFYRCASQHGIEQEMFYSPIYRFRMPLDGVDWSPKLLIFGDLGVENPATLPYLEQEIDKDNFDAIFHIGDIAYQMNSHGGAVGDLFMEEIENIASRVPYLVCPGNHDVDLFVDYNEYSKRFRMPGDFDSLVYSWNLGPVHFISISSEFYFYNSYKIEEQYLWVEQDLKEANRVRDTYPWIVVYGHTPMYCSNIGGGSCLNVNTPLRVGCANHLCKGLEDLFFQQGVDLILWGHEHSYEASFPVYNYTIYNGSLEEPYTNPKAPVHLITGAAGNKWLHDEYDETVPQPEWSRFRNAEYSYSVMNVINTTHLLWEQIVVPEGPRRTTQKDIAILDSFYLIQENHGPFPPPEKSTGIQF